MGKQEIKNNTGLLPPQSIELETQLLGCILVDPSVMGKISGIVAPDTFYNPAHKVIYEAMAALFKKNQNIDYLTVSDELKKMQSIDKAGGFEYVRDLSDVISASNYESYARKLEEKAIGRRLITACNETLSRVYEGSDDVFTVINEHTDFVFKSQSSLLSSKNVTPEYVGGLLIDSMFDGMSGNGVTGIPFGVREIDEYTNGKKGGRVYTIGARTRHGKSAVAAGFMFNSTLIPHPKFGDDISVVKNSIYPSAFLSMEMQNTEVYARLVSMEVKRAYNRHIPYSRIENGKIDSYQSDLVCKAVDSLSKRGIYIDDTPALNPMMVKSKVMKMINDYGIKEVYIDYIQLITDNEVRNKNRAQQISDWYTEFKNQAKFFNIPYIILSQVDRLTEKGGQAKPPVISDLKESGGIEEKSDVILLLYRPEVNDPNPTDEMGRSLQKTIFVDVAKNKQGGTGKVTMPFDVAINSFCNIDDFEPVQVTQTKIMNPNDDTPF